MVDEIVYYDGMITSVDNIIRDFEFSSRNDFLKYSCYYSKDGNFCATIYDGEKTSLIERMDD